MNGRFQILGKSDFPTVQISDFEKICLADFTEICQQNLLQGKFQILRNAASIFSQNHNPSKSAAHFLDFRFQILKLSEYLKIFADFSHPAPPFTTTTSLPYRGGARHYVEKLLSRVRRELPTSLPCALFCNTRLAQHISRVGDQNY